jgi:hypothetical protein
MTTVASGRCTSAPVEVATAMGINPELATQAVINTGRNLRRAPPRHDLLTEVCPSAFPCCYPLSLWIATLYPVEITADGILANDRRIILPALYTQLVQLCWRFVLKGVGLILIV